LELLDDVLELRPTVFFSVPRLYNRIYDRVMSTINAGNPVSRSLFQRAFAYKRAALERGDLSGGRFGPFWDSLVFSKIKARLGGILPAILSNVSFVYFAADARSFVQESATYALTNQGILGHD